MPGSPGCHACSPQELADSPWGPDMRGLRGQRPHLLLAQLLTSSLGIWEPTPPGRTAWGTPPAGGPEPVSPCPGHQWEHLQSHAACPFQARSGCHEGRTWNHRNFWTPRVASLQGKLAILCRPSWAWGVQRTPPCGPSQSSPQCAGIPPSRCPVPWGARCLAGRVQARRCVAHLPSLYLGGTVHRPDPGPTCPC